MLSNFRAEYRSGRLPFDLLMETLLDEIHVAGYLDEQVASEKATI